MDEAAPAAGAAVEKKRRLLRRVPTALLVTLLGIALTAWLLPAFTRQWDDRAKARELKASLASDIAAATARAIIRSRKELRTSAFAHHRYIGRPDREYNADADAEAGLNDQWLLDSIRIE